MNQTLFLLLGYPGSGKSAFSKQLSTARNIPRVNSDELRRYMYEDIKDIRDPGNNPAIFGALDYATERLLAVGQSIIYDANNNRRSDRAKHEVLAAKYGAQVVILWVKTPLEIAKQREAERVLEPGYFRILPERYQQIVDALEEPMPQEKVIVLDGLVSFEEQLQAFDSQLAEVG